MLKTPSSHIIHSLGGEYCWIVRDSEPIRLLKSPRSLSVYILKGYSYKVTTGIINPTYAKLKLHPVLGILLSIENLCFVGKGTWKCQKITR